MQGRIMPTFPDLFMKVSMADAPEELAEEPADDEQPAPLSTGQSTDAMDAEDASPSPDAPASPRASPTAASGPPIAVAIAPPLAIVPAARSAAASFAELATYTPMRLTIPERRLFRLLEAALTVSDYTDKVDILTWRRRDGRIVQQVKDICSILSGLVVAQVSSLHCQVDQTFPGRRCSHVPACMPRNPGMHSGASSCMLLPLIIRF